MSFAALILSFIFGTIVGSFLNVVSLRYKTGKGIGGRSACMSCGKKLEWLELIPVLSFLFLGGACKKCKSKISWQYPLVEFIAGAIFVLLFFRFPPTSSASAMILLINIVAACILLLITVHDVKHKIIPNAMVFTFDVLALVYIFVAGGHFQIPSYESLLAGPILALPFALIWLISRGKWMGLGDAKLVIGIGWFLGINAGINAVIISFWSGAILSVVWLFITYKKFKRHMEIPFGPYLVLGMYSVLIFGIQVMDIGIVREMLGL